MGGTWDLFRYPGVRSDSDIYTFSYLFRPWEGDQSLADGEGIRRYIEQVAAENGIDRRIRFGTKVVSASWSSDDARWTVRTEPSGAGAAERQPETWSCAFLYACAGYYDYSGGYTPTFPGQEDFAGQVVHPQSWPDDLDHAGRRVVVIGSGATAVTLVPAMAGTAAHVTMLQRSPTWITSLPRRDRLADRLRHRLPAPVAHRVIRAKNMAFSLGFYQFSRRRPAGGAGVPARPDRVPARRGVHRRALHAPLRPVGPAALRRAGRRPGQGDPARGRLGGHRPDRPLRARGDPAGLGRGAGGRPRRDRDRPADAAAQRPDLGGRRPADAARRAHAVPRADARRGAELRDGPGLRQRLLAAAGRPLQPLRLPLPQLPDAGTTWPTATPCDRPGWRNVRCCRSARATCSALWPASRCRARPSPG